MISLAILNILATRDCKTSSVLRPSVQTIMRYKSTQACKHRDRISVAESAATVLIVLSAVIPNETAVDATHRIAYVPASRVDNESLYT